MIYTTWITYKYPKLKIKVHMLACNVSVHASKIFIPIFWFTSLIITDITFNIDILCCVVSVRIVKFKKMDFQH